MSESLFERLYRALTHGPCANCGRRWFLGWMVTNLQGVCSFRCFKERIRG